MLRRMARPRFSKRRCHHVRPHGRVADRRHIGQQEVSPGTSPVSWSAEGGYMWAALKGVSSGVGIGGGGAENKNWRMQVALHTAVPVPPTADTP